MDHDWVVASLDIEDADLEQRPSIAGPMSIVRSSVPARLLDTAEAAERRDGLTNTQIPS